MSESERLPADERGGSANSGMIKKIALIGVLGGGLYVGYNVVKKSMNATEPKTAAEQNLEKLRKKQSELDKSAAAKQATVAATPTPQGDQEAQKMLQDLQAKKEAAIKARREAEEKAQMELEELNYQRKLQALPHEPPLAAAWERRLQNAQMTGQAIDRRNLTTEEEAVLKESNPKLLASLKELKVKTSSPGGARILGTPSNPTHMAAGTKNPGSAPGAPGSIPGSIDPHTGLPIQANASGESISAMLPDGTPDIEGGAIPVQMTYVPMGSKEPVTVTRWVKPGYLVGRSRPYNPAELMEADKMWRTSLRAPTEIEYDKVSGAVKIPIQANGNRQRVASDWQFVQRYVTVQPNPRGQLTPPNPPIPRN